MSKTLTIAINILVFFLIIGFGYYMVHSITSDEKNVSNDQESENRSLSPYIKTNSFDAASEIFSFDIYEHTIYMALFDRVSLFDLPGKHQRDFAIEANVRDMVIDNDVIYLLYPTRIDLYSLDGQKSAEWEACSSNDDYCSFTATADYLFVTDAANKNIVQYDKQGRLVRFIKSPQGFIIPGYSFDIISINDTVYCANSGRHQIESYTLDGEFIASFGVSGSHAGAFAGCCNPVYLEKSSGGHILTSEKGNPRISCYGRDGKYRTILFDHNMLGGGSTAYRVRVFEENIYVANKKRVSMYRFDTHLANKSCAGCQAECPLREGVKNNL